MKNLTKYEKALLRIELMKLKLHEINIDIGNCNASFMEKRTMKKEIEKTKDYIEKILKG